MEYKDVYYTMYDFEDYGVDFTEYHSDSECSIDIDSSLIDNDIIDELILLVYDRFFEFYIYKKEIGFFDTPTTPNATDWSIVAKRLNNVINMTYERYAPLLKMYRDNFTDPSPQLESSSEGKTRFNDTPQGDDLNDEYYADDTHATNVTASISNSKADSGSLVERLDALYRNWRDILRDWTNEFKGLFREVWR